MRTVFNCHHCSLRVRVTNRAAISLYEGVLQYKIRYTEKQYYADGEDAFDMCYTFPKIEKVPDEDKEGKALDKSDPGMKNLLLAESNPQAGKKKKVKVEEKKEELIKEVGEEKKQEMTEEEKAAAEARAAKNRKKKEKQKAKKAAQTTEKPGEEEKS